METLQERCDHTTFELKTLWTISYAVGFVSRKRPFSTEAQIGLSYAVENGLFRLNTFFDREFLLADPVEKLDFFDSILQSKNSTDKFHTCLLNRSLRPSHHETNAHTATHPFQVPHCCII